MTKNSKYIRITGEELKILRKLIGRQLVTVYSPGLSVRSNEIWSTCFSVDYTGTSINSPLFEPLIKIEADYKWTENSTTYFQFEITEETTPTGVTRTDDNSLLWPFGEIQVWSSTIKKVTICDDWNEEDDRVVYDTLILITTDKELICIEAENSAMGGVIFSNSKKDIKRKLKNLKISNEINAR